MRLGLTMRTADATAYDEPRDALAADWPVFLSTYLSEASWLALPNLGAATVTYAEAEGVDGLILTGGDDIGGSPRRDDSERALLSWAKANKLPVFGVCRGLQVLHWAEGGHLVPCDRAKHVAQTHPVTWSETNEAWAVNSYHGFALPEGGPLETLATSADGLVEAARHDSLPWMGVMWHPERPNGQAERTSTLMRALFSEDQS